MVAELQRINFDTVNLDEALALSAFAKSLRGEYDARQLEVPEWLDTKQRELNRFIDLKAFDIREKRIRDLRRELASTETTSEKRERLRAELARMEPVGAGEAAKV